MIQYIEHIFIGLTFFVTIVALFFWILIIFALFMFFRQVKNCDIERQSPTTDTPFRYELLCQLFRALR